MGTGRSGLSKGISRGKNLSEFKITAKNLKDYNIKMESRLKKNVPEEYLNRALDTLNHLANILGMDPNDLPAVSLGFTTRAGIYGDCRMAGTWDNLNADARIRLHPDMFADANYDTMAHEYVHALEAWMIKTNIKGSIDRCYAWNDHIYSEAMCVSALQKLGKLSGPTFDRDVWKREANTIKLHKYDSYASSDPAETVTRAVQTVLRFGDKASPFAKAVVEELRKEVLNTQKTRKKK